MPDEVDIRPDGVAIRQGKQEEGKSDGEGWAALRALFLIVLLTAFLAWLIF